MKIFSSFITITIIVAAFFAVSCGGDATTERWKYLGDIPQKSDNVISIFLDTETIEIDGDTRKFWIKYVERNPEDTQDPGYIRQKGYWEVDCFDRKLFKLKEEYYNPSSQLISTDDKRKEEKYDSDQSLGAKMSYAACRYAGG